MARIDIRSNGGGSVATGVLQLENGVAMDTTLRNVADQNDTTSPLKLSTTAVQVTSPLRITTSDASGFYLDAEDSATNNRFSIKRDPSSQEVTLDFASNPAGSTTLVGAIRTYKDGVNLSNAMSFIEDGSVGVGTNAPVGLLDLYKAAATTRLAIRGDAGQNRLISYRTGAVQRFGLYVNNTAESGSNAGSNFAIRAYSDAGALLTTPFFINRATGNVGVNTLTGTAKLQVVGSGSTSATTSFLVQNSTPSTLFSIADNGNITQSVGSSSFFNTVTILNGGLNASAGLITTTGNLVGSGASCRIGELQILATGNAGSTGLGISTPDSTIIFQGYTLGTAGTGSMFTFRKYDSTTNPLNTISSGILRITNVGFQSGNANNLSGNTLWIEPIYNLTDAGRSGTTVRGIYYNPTLTSLVNTNHYGIQTTSGGAYINTATPQASAVIQADSTTQGFLPPRMTTAQKVTLAATAVAGLMIYDTDLNKLCVYTGAGWETITSI